MAKKLLATWMKTADFTEFANQVTLLWELGHLPNYATYEDARAAITNREHPDFLAGTASYQSFSRRTDGMPLAMDAHFGSVTARSVGERFCACPDIRRAGGVAKWSFTDVNCWFRGPNNLGFSSTDIRNRWLKAGQTWGKFCPLTLRWWTEDDGNHGPNIYCDTYRIDGPYNILAFMYLCSVNAPKTEKNQQVIDTAENWQANDWFLNVVVAHEFGHAHGLDHIPVSGPRGGKALMNPMAQKLEGSHPQQPLDIEAIQRVYGKRTPTDPDPGPDPQPPPDGGVEVLGSEHLGTAKDGRVLIATYTLETRE